MDIRHLRTLVAIVEYGTFGAAGDAVYLSQSAVSQQVRAIEEFLGFKIFDRTVRPPALTARGAILLDGAKKIVTAYDETIQSLTGDRPSGQLMLGAIRASFKSVLPKALAILRDRYPDLHVHVQTAVSKDLVASVEAGALDAAIIASGRELKKNLCWLPYTNEHFVVLADLHAKGQTDKELLENSPYIRYFSNSSAAFMIDKELDRRNISVHSRIDIDALEPIVGLVEQGLGVSIVPEPVGSTLLSSKIRRIPFGEPHLVRQLGIVYQQTSTKEKVISLLHNELHKLSGYPEFSD